MKELSALNKEALEAKLTDLRKDLMKSNSQVAVGTVPKNVGQLKTTKKNIARILTILRQRRDNQKG